MEKGNNIHKLTNMTLYIVNWFYMTNLRMYNIVYIHRYVRTYIRTHTCVCVYAHVRVMYTTYKESANLSVSSKVVAAVLAMLEMWVEVAELEVIVDKVTSGFNLFFVVSPKVTRDSDSDRRRFSSCLAGGTHLLSEFMSAPGAKTSIKQIS